MMIKKNCRYDKTEIKVGDYLYKMCYYTHPFKNATRSISKKKVQKISYNAARFADKESVSLGAINNLYVDEWYTSRKEMYNGKLRTYLDENEEVLSEIKYLDKKIKALD